MAVRPIHDFEIQETQIIHATDQMSQEEDKEQNLNEYEHYQNANTGTNFNDAYKNDYQMDTDLSYRIAGYDSKKGYRQLAKEEVAKAPVENSEMYQGMLAVDNFLEVTAGTLSSKAKQSQEDMAFEELKRKTEKFNDYNGSVNRILGEELGQNYHIDLSEAYGNGKGKNAGIFENYGQSKTDTGQLSTPYVKEKFTISSENYLKALRGDKVEIRLEDGMVKKVDASKWIIHDENMQGLTLQERFKRNTKIKNRQDLVKFEKKNVSKVLEHVGIRNAEKLSKGELKKLAQTATNDDVKSIINTMIDLKDFEEKQGKTRGSKRRTKRSRTQFFRGRLLKDCDLTSGLYVAASSMRIGKKITKGALYASHYVSSKALTATAQVGKQIAIAGHSLAVETGVSKINGYYDLYAKVSKIGNKADLVANSYKELPQNLTKKINDTKSNFADKKSAFKGSKANRRIKRNEMIYERLERHKFGRAINKNSEKIRGVRKKVLEKTEIVFGRFQPIKIITNKVKTIIISPFKELANVISKFRGVIIKIAISCAQMLLLLIAISVVANFIFMGLEGVLCTVTSFEEDDGGISIGQNAVNKLRAQGGNFVRNASDVRNISSEVSAVSGRCDAGGVPFQVTIDSAVTCIYEDTSGNRISSTDFYNVKEILSSAEIHFMSDYTKESYYEYTKELWANTHSYYIEFSDVYYCDDYENCDNWHDVQHDYNQLNACNNIQIYYSADGTQSEYCGGHSMCGGHVKAEVHLVAERGLDEMKSRVAELAGCMSYVPPYGWVGNRTDEIDYINDTYYDDMYEVFMSLDWQEEYGISLGAGTFNAANVELSGETTQAIHDFLVGCGYSEAGIAGIMGNLQAESGLNPTATNGRTIGIAQWLGGRIDNLMNFCANDGYDPYSLEGQLNFLYYEMSTGYPRVHAAMMSATDPEEAASFFCAYYEGCYASPGDGFYGNPDCYYFVSIRYQYWQALNARKSNASAYFNAFDSQ